MDPETVLQKFEHLHEQYDEFHRPGPWHRLKDELDLGSGPFNDRLITGELQDLNRAMEERLTNLTEHRGGPPHEHRSRKN